MFVGVSKNIGNGFRVGLGTKLGGGKKPSSKELNTKEFQEFMHKVQADINNALLVFLEANGQSYKKLVKSKVDLDDVFKDNSDYQEFISIFNQTKRDIEKVLYSGDSGVVAKRAITESVFALKEFMDSKYPNVVPKEKIKKPMNKFLKWFLIIFAILFFVGLFGEDKKDNIAQQETTSSTQTISK
jgi:hypothetical protein